MNVVDYIRDHCKDHTRNNAEMNPDQKGKFLREMYDRYVEHRRSGRYSHIEPIEVFAFCMFARYAWPVGTLVKVRGDKDPTKISIVKGWSEDRAQDYVNIGPGDYCASACNIVRAEVPQSILEIVKEQMAGKCPLKEAAPCLS